MKLNQEQLSLDLGTPKKLEGVGQKDSLEDTLSVSLTSKRVEKLLNSSQNYNFNYLNYSSYKIEVENGKISKIYFSFGKDKFLVYLKNYDFFKKEIKRFDYTETNKEDREIYIKKVYIRNLEILGIQKKVKVGYGEFKKSPNYFRYLGIDYNSIIVFIEKLLQNYHYN